MPTTNPEGPAERPRLEQPVDGAERLEEKRSALVQAERLRAIAPEHVARPGAIDRYVVPTLAIGFVLALKLALPELLGRNAPFVLLSAAILISAWRGGLIGGLLATAIGALATTYFFFPGLNAFDAGSGAIAVRLVAFLFESALLTGLIVWAQRSQDKAEPSSRRVARLEAERSRVLDREKSARAEAERAREAAEDARRSLSTTLTSIGDAVIATDGSGRVSFMNPIAEDLTGWPSAEATGKPIEAIFPLLNETGAAVESPIARVLREGAAVRLENPTKLRPRNGAERAIADSAAPIRNERGEITGVVLVFRDVTRERQEEERRRFLAEVTSVLAASIDYHATLRSVAQLAVPRLADWCVVELTDEDEPKSRQLAVAHVDPAKVRLAYELNERYPPDPEAKAGVPEVLRTGRPEIYSEIPEDLLKETAVDEEHLRIMLELKLESAIIVPLIGSNGRTIGAITFVYADSKRRYDQADLIFAQELARRAAIAVENAHLLRSQRQARELAESARSGIGALQEVTSKLAEALTPDEVAGVAVEQGGRAVGAASTILYVAGADGALSLLRYDGVHEDDVAALRELAKDSDLLAAQTARARDPIWIEDAEGDPRAFSELAARIKAAGSLDAFACIPLAGNAGIVAVLVFGFSEAREFREQERAFILTLARHSGQALDRARLYEVAKRAEADAKNERQRMENLFMQAPLAIILVRGPRHTLDLLNPLGQQMFGAREELIGLPIEEAVPGIDRRTIEILDEIRATGVPFMGRGLSFKLDWNHDGELTERFVDVNWQPIREIGGAVEGVMILFSDVTDQMVARRQIEEAVRMREEALLQLQRREELLSVIMDAVPALISYIDAEGRYRLCNKTYDLWMGDRSRLLGQPADEGLGEDADRMIGPHIQRALAGEPTSYEAEIEFPGIGTRWIRASYTPHITADNTVEGIVVLGNDITDRRRSERAWRQLAEVGVVISASLDYETTLGRITSLIVPEFADACTIDLVTGLGKLATRQVAAAHIDPAKVPLLAALREKNPIDPTAPYGRGHVMRTGTPELSAHVTEEMMHRRTGSPEVVEILKQIDLRSVITVALVVRGRTTGTMTFILGSSGRHYEESDVTIAQELSRRAAIAIDNAVLYRESVAANRAKDEFLAVVSHELRTPLTSIMGWAYLLRSGRLSETQRVRAVDTIDRNAQTQARLVEDILDISRIITGKLRLDVRPVELERVIANALDAVRPAAEAKGVELTSRVEPQVGPVMGDEERLQQVIWNVISNAVKFTRKGGRVGVLLTRSGSQAEIRIADTGQGIEPGFLPFVFEQFRQADSGTSREHGGLGLGLSISRHIIELHGGTIEAKSAGKDTGAEFVIRLQAAALALSEPRRTPPAIARCDTPRRKLTTDLDGLRLLIVEDDFDTRELLMSVLGGSRAAVAGAATAEQALEAFQKERPDVILSDVGLPGGDGYSLIRRIRALTEAEGGSTPAIALTAHARASDRSRAIEEGFDTHMTKPVDPAVLIQMIAHLARSRDRTASAPPRES